MLRMTGVRKAFGPVVALDEVDFEVAAGEVHGLLGGNGAGKTTLMNVLYGLYRPDAGRVELNGHAVDIRSPRDAIGHGVGMVHQSFLQVDTYSVTENVILGTDQPSFPTLRLAAAERQLAELSARFGLAVEPRALVRDLSVGLRQRVEILKTLYRGARLLVLDEPTTNLTPHEVDSLFGSLRNIVDDGTGVVFITHKIREAMAICDRMSVMRDGHRAATVARGDVDAAALAGLMVGEEPSQLAGSDLAAAGAGSAAPRLVPTAAAATADARVQVSGLRVRGDHGAVVVPDVDLAVGRGEVLGVAGVAGNGQVELVEALSGVRAPDAGSVRLDGHDLIGRMTAEWLRTGVTYIPEDRARDGILPGSSVAENLVLGFQRSPAIRRRGLVDWARVRREAAQTVKDYKIRTAGVGAPAGALSGGNMQRIIVARAFAHAPALLLMHNPTRGLDIHSTRFVYERVREATAGGAAVVLVTEDLDELMQLSDRVLVLYDGRLVAEHAKDDFDPYEIGRQMTGVGEGG